MSTMMGWLEQRATWWLTAALLCLWPGTSRAGRLDSVRDEVSGRSSSSSDDSSSSSSSSSSDSSSCCDFFADDDDYGSSSSSSGGGGGSGLSLWKAPRYSPSRYRHYPYEGGSSDYMFVPRRGDKEARSLAGRVHGEGAWLGQGLWRSGGGLRLDARFLSVDADLSYYLEPGANDALYLGTANLSLIPISERRSILRLGGGINTMIDGRVPGEGPREYALGWNLTASFDVFPVWPVVVSGRVDAGKLYAAWMVRGRGTLGVMLWRMEIYGGYEHTQVGRVGMGGPTAGIRLWL